MTWDGYIRKERKYKESQIFKGNKELLITIFKEGGNQNRQQEAENLRIVFWKEF